MCEVLKQSYLENKGRLTDMTLLPQKPSLVQQQSPLPTLHKMNCLNLKQPSATSLFGQTACSCTRAVYCAHYHSSVHLSQGQSEQRLPKSSTLWLSSSAGRGSHCPSPKGLLWIASEIIRFFFAKHSTIELVGYCNGESKWTHTHFWGSELHGCEKATKITPAFPGLWVKLSGKEDFRQTHGAAGGSHLGPTISHHACPVSPKKYLHHFGKPEICGWKSEVTQKCCERTGWSPSSDTTTCSVRSQWPKQERKQNVPSAGNKKKFGNREPLCPRLLDDI